VNLSTTIVTTMKPLNNIENENSTIASKQEGEEKKRKEI
jgi:hypothetical protein